jgi:hypothetical protein
MSRRARFQFKLVLSLTDKEHRKFYRALSIHESENTRFRLSVNEKKEATIVTIEAADTNMLVSTANTILQSIKMLDDIRKL